METTFNTLLSGFNQDTRQKQTDAINRFSTQGGSTAANGVLSPNSMSIGNTGSPTSIGQALDNQFPFRQAMAPNLQGINLQPTQQTQQPQGRYGSPQLGYYDTWEEALQAIDKQNSPSSVNLKIDDQIPSEALDTTPSGTTMSEDRKATQAEVLSRRFEKEEEQLLASIANLHSGIADLSATQQREFFDLEKNPEGVFGGVLGSQLERLSRDQAIELNARTGQLQAQLDTLAMYQGYRPDVLGSPQIDGATGEAFVYMRDPQTGEVSVQSLGQIMTPEEASSQGFTLSPGQTRFDAQGNPIAQAAPTAPGGAGRAGGSGMSPMIQKGTEIMLTEAQDLLYLLGAAAAPASEHMKTVKPLGSMAGGSGNIGALTRQVGKITSPTIREANRLAKSIESNIGILSLLEIRASGATLGQIPQTQLETLQRLMGDLKITRDPVTLAGTIQRIVDTYSDLISNSEIQGILGTSPAGAAGQTERPSLDSFNF